MMDNIWEEIKKILKAKANIKVTEKDDGIVEVTKISAFGNTSVEVDTNKFPNEFQTPIEYGSKDWIAVLLIRAANAFLTKKEYDACMELDCIKFNYL